MGEIAIIFALCLLSEGISAALPFAFPASVISMLLLLVLLLCKVVKQQHIGRVTQFFTGNMAFFFIPPCVAIMEQWDALSAFLVPFLIISLLTTPLIYAATAWSIQLIMGCRRGKEDDHV